MHIFTLVYDKLNDIILDIKEIIERFDVDDRKVGMLESVEGNTHFLKIIINEDIDPNNKWINKLYYEFSNVIYKLLVNEYDRIKLTSYVEDNYYLFKQDEIDEVKEIVVKSLIGEGEIKNKSAVFCINRKNKIISDITNILKEYSELNISGFINFRMKEYEPTFNLAVEKTVEKYIVEKEYLEFIRLLKYFVEIQECKVETMNIYVTPSSEYNVTDGEGEQIELEEESTDSNYKSSQDDLLMSTLISNAPNKIIFHDIENCVNEEFKDTIFKVFGEKVEICAGCADCKKNEFVLNRYYLKRN